MTFKMHCIKCGSTDLDLHPNGANRRGGVRTLVYLELHCRTCGKTLAGKERVEAEFDRQNAAWISKKAAATRERKQIAAAAQEVERLATVERERLATAREVKRLAEEKAARRDQCAWVECSEPRREKSIYCGRYCSNKNARARHRDRTKKVPRRAA